MGRRPSFQPVTIVIESACPETLRCLRATIRQVGEGTRLKLTCPGEARPDAELFARATED